MTSPSPTLALARRLGTALGLSEGLNGPMTLRMSSGDLQALLNAFRDLTNLDVDRQQSRCKAEFRALYLPSFLRTLLNNPIDAFIAIDPILMHAYTTFAKMHFPSEGINRFLREHQTETVELRAKALSLIVDWSDRKKIIPSGMWTSVLKDLVVLYGDLTQADRLAHDDGPLGFKDPLRVSSKVQTRLRASMNRLKTLVASVEDVDEDDVDYTCALDRIRIAVFPERCDLPRGSAYIDELIGQGVYLSWWSCEKAYVDEESSESDPRTPCDEANRDKLRTCARCRQVRYCSERHQKADWKQHKFICVASTW